ncbi:hypothetical protein ES703_59567 [subsurface metagenome]
MKRFLKHFRYGQKGFTLIELLVVIGILGAIAAVVVPNVGSFIGRGKTEAQSTELHNIQTSVMAMMVDSASGQLDGAVAATTDMYTVLATDESAVVLHLSDYLTGLGDDPATPVITEDTCVKLGCEYEFAIDGTVTQLPPP